MRGGSPSMSRKAPRCSSPRPVGASQNPDQYSSSGSQSNGSKYIDQARKKAAQRLGALGPLLNRRSSLSIMNGILQYKYLIRPMMDYACPVWRSAALSNIKKLQVLQSKSLCIATNAPPGTLVTGKFTMILKSPTSPTISDL